jgi:hypothetical protein
MQSTLHEGADTGHCEVKNALLGRYLSDASRDSAICIDRVRGDIWIGSEALLRGE